MLASYVISFVFPLMSCFSSRYDLESLVEKIDVI